MDQQMNSTLQSTTSPLSLVTQKPLQDVHRSQDCLYYYEFLLLLHTLKLLLAYRAYAELHPHRNNVNSSPNLQNYSKLFQLLCSYLFSNYLSQ